MLSKLNIQKTEIATFTTSTKYNEAKKKKKTYKLGTDKIKLFLFVVYEENSQEVNKLELVKFSKVTGHKVNKQKSNIYALAMCHFVINIRKKKGI